MKSVKLDAAVRSCIQGHLAIALILVSAGVRPLPAQEANYDLAALSLEELMEIEVTLASRRPQKVSESAAAIAVVTRDELQRAGVRTLPDALRLVPGMQVGQIDANKWMVTARGFAGLFSNKLLVLMDGRSVYTPLFSGVFWESQDVLIEDLDRIEVLRGPGGTLWGANAVNGIINIVTRDAVESRGTYVEAGGGRERGYAVARHGFAIGRGHARVFVKGFRRGRSAAVTAAPARDDWDMIRGGFRADFELDARDRITLLGSVQRSTLGQSLTYVAHEPPPLAQLYYFDTPTAGGDILVRGRRRWRAETETEVQLYYDVYDREEAILQGRIHNADLDVKQQLRWGRHRLVLGSGYRRTWDDIDSTFTAWVTSPSRTTHLFSGFAHDDIDLVAERLRVSIGAKVEHNSFTGFEVQPNARLWYSPNPQHDLWLAVSRPLRTPARGDHDLQAILTSFETDSLPVLVQVDNNRRFRAEKMVAVDGGYRFAVGPAWFADVSAFYNRYDDLLTQEPGLWYAAGEESARYFILPLRLANLARARAVGAEVAVDWTGLSWSQVRAVYSYLNLDVELDAGSLDTVTGSHETSSPHHQLALRSLSDVGPWSVAVTGRWVSALEDLGDGTGIDAYGTIDARLARSFGHGFEISLAGRNLLEAEHREAYSATVGSAPTAVQREAYLAVTWRR